MKAILCDGTSVNTGRVSGVIKRLELFIGRPLQWLICLLHFNELPFRHIFSEMDGPSIGPVNLCGPIGKQLLENLSKKPIVDFVPVKGSFEPFSQDLVN